MRCFGGGTRNWTAELMVMIGTFFSPRARPTVRPDFEWTRLWTDSLARSATVRRPSFATPIVWNERVIGLG